MNCARQLQQARKLYLIANSDKQSVKLFFPEHHSKYSTLFWQFQITDSKLKQTVLYLRLILREWGHAGNPMTTPCPCYRTLPIQKPKKVHFTRFFPQIVHIWCLVLGMLSPDQPWPLLTPFQPSRSSVDYVSTSFGWKSQSDYALSIHPYDLECAFLPTLLRMIVLNLQYK